MPTIKIECQSLAGETTATAAVRDSDASGTATAVSVSEQATAGLYWVTLTYDDSGSRPLGNWAVTLGGVITIATLSDSYDTYSLGVTSASSTQTGLYSLTVNVDDSQGSAVRGARVAVSGTDYSVTTDTNGAAVLSLDAGSYSLIVSPPSGFDSLAAVPVTVSADSSVIISLTESVSQSSGSGWLG